MNKDISNVWPHTPLAVNVGFRRKNRNQVDRCDFYETITEVDHSSWAAL